jgi:hypothetical protein
MYKLNIPASFKHDLFFQNQHVIYMERNDEHILTGKCFRFDIAYHQNIDLYKPWLNIADVIPVLIKEWGNLDEEISLHFSNRDRNRAKPYMVRAVSLFICSLFWVNEKPVPRLVGMEQDVNHLKISPVNAKERLSYIITSPNHYLSHIQLGELFQELNKQFVKQQIYYNKNSN